MEEAKVIADGIKKYLRQAKKMRLLPAVISQLQKDGEEKLTLVESVVELLEPERQEIETMITKKFGTVKEISYVVNPDLLGGVRISIGSMVLDLSVLKELMGSYEN